MPHARPKSHVPSARRPRLPFDRAERKKLIILAILVAIGGAIVGGQLLKNKGPATAQAAEPAAGAQTIDLDDLVRQMRQSDPAPAGPDKPLFATVDEALELFLGGSKPEPIPLDQLARSVFGLPEEYLRPPPAPEKERPPETPPAAEAAPEAKKPPDDPAAADLARLNLETVLVSSRNQAAIINGQVLHCGETVCGFLILEISRGRVVMERDGKRYNLELK